MFRLGSLYFLLAVLVSAQDWSLDHLFTRPFVWGTGPTEITWAKHAHTLAFLWNDKGNGFRDLYSFNAETKKLVRLTDLENLRDPINESDAEKDPHRKDYVPPKSGLTAFDISDDGTRITFSYRNDLFVVPSAGGAYQRLTRTKAPEVDPTFSPDAERVAFTQSGQLYVLSLNGGALEQITDVKPPASLKSYHWSPDGKYFSYSVQPRPTRTLPLPNYSGQFGTAAPFQRNVAGDAPAALQHFLVDSNGENVRLLETGKGIGNRPPKWSEDSRHLVLASLAANYKSEEVRVIDASTAKSTIVFQQNDDRWAEVSDTGFSQDSRHIWLTSDRTGFQHLYTVDLDGKNRKQLTKGDWEIHRDPFSTSPQWIGDAIYYSSTQDGTAERQFYRVRADGSQAPERLSQKEGLHIVTMSEDGQQRAAMQADLTNPFDLYVNDERITKSPQPEFYRMRWPESRFVSYPSPHDRKPVAARLLLPPGYRTDRKSEYPAVVYIHGSGYATSVLKQWGSYQELRFVFNNYLAHQGYVVLEMDYRGSTNYGRDWRSGVYLNMGGPDLEDVLGGIEYLKKLGNVDMKRVGIWGWSYGGFMTAMAMFRAPDTFKAGAAFSGVYDWENYNAEYTGERLTTPAENPEAYRRSSPIHYSNQLKNPLLIIHGIVDNNVLFQDAVQLTEKLVHEGKPFEESFYPEESHAYVRDESLRDAWKRAARFFQEHLGEQAR